MKRRRLAQATLAMGLCMLAVPALAAAGTIKGKVVDETTSKGIKGLPVCAYPYGGAGTCTTSGPGGKYSIAGLPAGTYKVEFSAVKAPEWHPALNYITEYYDNQPTFEFAEKVTVGKKGVTSGINAALAVGGQITGTVTDEATGQPIEGIQACAFIIGTDILSCDRTDANGSYDVIGLPSNDVYKVEFSARGTELEYEQEYYDNQESAVHGTSVTVVAGSVTSGIDAQLAP